MKIMLTSFFFVLSTSALAQELDAGMSLTPSESSVETPAEPPALNALQTDSEKMGWLQGKVEALESDFIENKNVVNTLSKIKLSGYIQARYTINDTSDDGLTNNATPAVTDGFSVRRGRFKVQYAGTVAGFVLQVDAAPTGVLLRDAEVSLTEPFTGKQVLTLIAGETKWPFGYEVPQSSGDREFPERTRVVRAFLPGERDRGVKLNFKYDFLRANIGLFDGDGINGYTYNNAAGATTNFLGLDNDRAKDVIGRIGVDFKWFSAGISGWTGETLRIETPTATRQWFPRQRVGLDAQLYLDVLPFGGTAIKAEFIAGRTYVAGTERFGQTALGWYALLIQNIGDREQVGFRYDFFNPATGTLPGVDPKDAAKPASTNSVHTVGFLVTHHFDEVLKLSVVYEIPIVDTTGTEAVAPQQKLFTIQMQAKF
jgi:hypothetical protein